MLQKIFALKAKIAISTRFTDHLYKVHINDKTQNDCYCIVEQGLLGIAFRLYTSVFTTIRFLIYNQGSLYNLTNLFFQVLQAALPQCPHFKSRIN